jgi:hypothetical protein
MSNVAEMLLAKKRGVNKSNKPQKHKNPEYLAIYMVFILTYLSELVLACHAKKNENYSIKFGAWLGRSYRV